MFIFCVYLGMRWWQKVLNPTQKRLKIWSSYQIFGNGWDENTLALPCMYMFIYMHVFFINVRKVT